MTETRVHQSVLGHGPMEDNAVDLTQFAPNLSDHDLQLLLDKRLKQPPFFPWFTIETLSPTKMQGLGRTNLTLILATIVQVDATTPYAGFEQAGGTVHIPAVSMHFTPAAYGITAAESFVMNFAVSTSGPVTFQIGGYDGGSTIAGTKTINGTGTVSVPLSNVTPSLPASGYIERVAGGAWSWYRTSVSRPLPVVQL